MGTGSNSVIFDDLEWPQTWVSRSLYIQVEYLKTGAF